MTHKQGSQALQRISVVIVNYGTAPSTIAGIQSVLDHEHAGRDVDVHVVDNASPDDSAHQLATAHAERAWGDRVTLYPETENHGFGRGNNVALYALNAQDTPPDAVFFLNPDAYLENEAVDILAKALEQDAHAGIAGAGITNPAGVPETAAFRFPSIIGEFSSALNFGPVARALQNWQVPLPPDHPMGPVGWVSGAAFLARFEALQDVGFFDPGYFLYYEEVDLMRQAANKGWARLYIPLARVVHVGGEATGMQTQRAERSRIPAYHYHSWQYYFANNHSWATALAAALAKVIGSAGNKVLSKLRNRPSQVADKFFVDFWSYSVRPLLGRAQKTDQG